MLKIRKKDYLPETLSDYFSRIAGVVFLELRFDFFILLFKDLLQFWKNKMNVGLRELGRVLLHILHSILICVNQDELVFVELDICSDV